jgi:uroporphyrinogen-III synthase
LSKRVIVTRPLRDAQAWVSDLSAADLHGVALPLIEIRPADDPAPLQRAWQQLAGYAGVMFVSANAVDSFFASRPLSAISFGVEGAIKTRAWATGPGTAAALARAGVAPQCVDAPAADAAQFDSEALWRLVGAGIKPAQRVLIVRGSDGQSESAAQGVGRDWFAQRVGEAGAQVDYVVSYRRVRPHLDAAQLELARAAAVDGSVWLFSSSEALLNLLTSLPGQDWRAARAVATHARIAVAARQAGFGTVVESRPALADIKASIESIP